jgi:small-conductance mechanosensitive channel
MMAQSDSSAQASLRRAPVIVDKDTLFSLHAYLGPFSPGERAKGINEKLEAIVHAGVGNRDTMFVQDSGGISDIILDTVVLMGVTDADAKGSGTSRLEYAQSLAGLLWAKVRIVKKQYTLSQITVDALHAGAALIVCLVLFWIMAKAFPRLYSMLDRATKAFAGLLSLRSHRLITPQLISDTIVIAMKGVRLVLTLLLLYYWVLYTFSLFPWTRRWNIEPCLRSILFAAVLTLTCVAIVRGIHRILHALTNRIPEWKGTYIHSIKIKNINLLTEDRIAGMLLLTSKFLGFAGYFLIGYFYATVLFSLFDFTRTWAQVLFGFIADPFTAAISAFVRYLPNLFSVLVMLFIARYVLKFVHFIFAEIERGAIAFPNFHRDWAEPTYKIIRFLIIVFIAIVIFPYLPGSTSPVFQGISVFVGILFSLGSTSAVANIVAGVVLTYMRPFKLGDRVKIADTVGDVIEKTLLVTRVRTIKNVDVTIPNAMVMASHIINYNSSANIGGLILHTSVTIGYDAPWKTVHQLLLSAADSTSHVLKEPSPFVLQTSLNDFYVTYELNAYTDAPNKMAQTYSDLHQNIQDKFNEAKIEIMSPHYAAVRDGNRTAVPEGYLPKSYTPRSFRIFPFGDISKSNDEEKP